MKHRRLTKKEHKAKISLITMGLMAVTIVLLVAAVVSCVNNRESFIRAMQNITSETDNILHIRKELADKVDLEIASATATTSGRVSLQVKATSTNSDTFKEYRYYIKESTNDMYVLDAITIEEQHAYVKLNPATEYDVKVEAVCHDGKTMESTTSGETPSID